MHKKLLKRVAATVLAALMLFTVSGPETAYADSAKTIRIKIGYGQTEARSILGMINSFRTGKNAWYWNESNTKKVKVRGLKKLKYDYGLEKIAMQRAAEIAVTFAHQRPDGRDCFSAYEDLGYHLSACGENIAYGQSSAKEVNNDWREDDQKYEGQGHRRNMLGGGIGFAYVGIGHAEVGGADFWVEEFSSEPTGAKKTAAKNGNKAVSVRAPGNSVVKSNGKKYLISDVKWFNETTWNSEKIRIPLA